VADAEAVSSNVDDDAYGIVREGERVSRPHDGQMYRDVDEMGSDMWVDGDPVAPDGEPLVVTVSELDAVLRGKRAASVCCPVGEAPAKSRAPTAAARGSGTGGEMSTGPAEAESELRGLYGPAEAESELRGLSGESELRGLYGPAEAESELRGLRGERAAKRVLSCRRGADEEQSAGSYCAWTRYWR